MPRKTVKSLTVTQQDIDNFHEEHKALISEFISYKSAEGKSKETLKVYLNNLYLFFNYFEKNCKIKGKPKMFYQLKVKDIISFQSLLINLGLSGARIANLRSTISSLCNYCENILAEDEDFEEYANFRNPVGKVKAPMKEEVREKTVLTDSQCQDYLDRLVEEKRFQQACAFALAWSSGRRKSELLRIKRSFISDENIKFGSLYKSPCKIQTKGKMLEVYVIKNKFKPYFDLWMNERKELGVPDEIDDIFVKKTKDGWQPAKLSQLNYYADVFSKDMGISFYFHALRHNFTTELLKAGLPEAVVQQIVGWSSLDMVVHYDDREKDELLADYFSEEGIKQKEVKGLSDL